ncbi:metal-dependent hydrolase [Aliidiomarina quisquiliarum]|uniref:metal-dependent hydrolase n=1 Tax=Aliidiomarina quisquiliarum TaxID=2938947 RepID=UPI00208E42E4|nr:metal-dependent hydrolase [Aliidiomarina quisquiliarum]MCO4319890.1 metal-dependent hydrolase [Aliidiomarina quisquiliarum]
MMFRNHLIVATAIYAVATNIGVSFFDWPLQWELVWRYGLVLLGCSLVDIDYPSSTVGKRVKWISWPIYVLFGHRGITHSAFMVAIIFGAAWAFEFRALYWLGLGWVLHLVGDYLTDSGIPLMWPSKRRYRFPVYASTNSLSEPIMVGIITIGSIIFVIFI